MMSHRASSAVIVLLTILFIVPTSAEWLEFGAGCPAGSEPLIFHNITLEDLISFDVELQGLLADTVKYDEIKYLRFSNSPGTVPMSETGYPELPVVTCFVAVPDESDLDLVYSANCIEAMECIPVYPAPLDSLVEDSTSTPYIGEFFRKDSTAYASGDWFPEDLAVLVGEFTLRDQRIAVVNVYPVQYLASEDSLRVWSDIDASVNFTGADPDWYEDGMGYYDLLIGDRVLGYRPDYAPIDAPDPDWFRHEAPFGTPPAIPDYVIIVAPDLDGDHVEDFAEYRSNLNSFDVMITNIDDILDEYGGSATYVTDEIIRDYTDDIWSEWSSPGDRPTYLLLIGDHEDGSQATEPWLLPTFEAGNSTGYGNDEWYTYFDESWSISASFPNMIVGRLPARSVSELVDMLDLITDYEAGIQTPGPSYRRHLIRLAGTDEFDEGTPMLKDLWEPSVGWTEGFKDWLGYTWDNYYCGDGDDQTFSDGSTMSSEDWVDACEEVFEHGALVAFFSDHGDFHMFSAGLDWGTSPPAPPDFGLPDYTFNTLDVVALTQSTRSFWSPLVLMLCCSAGTFNHTEAEHPEIQSLYPCFCEGTSYDFTTDCLAESFMRNTDCGAIGVFAASNTSDILRFRYIGEGILTALLEKGYSRIGDAIQYSRIANLQQFVSGTPSQGFWDDAIAVYNLLGDPAVDIGDRMKFRSHCDLIIGPSDMSMNRYPSISVNDRDSQAEVLVRVRNAGAAPSGTFDVDLKILHGTTTDRATARCIGGLSAGEETVLTLIWEDPPDNITNTKVLFSAIADPDEDSPDSWWSNNSASTKISICDFYPNEHGWPVRLTGSIKAPPLLAQLDGDDDLEIVAVAGNMVYAYDPDDSTAPIWSSGPYELNPDYTSVGELLVFDGYTIPAAGDLTDDGIDEIIVDAFDRLLVLRGGTGTELDALSHADLGDEWTEHPHAVVLADVFPDTPRDSELEIAVQCNGNLLIVDFDDGELTTLDSVVIPCSGADNFGWLVAEDLDSDGYDEIIFSGTWTEFFPTQTVSGVCIYNHSTGTFTDSEEWEDESFLGIPAVGTLPTVGQTIALSRRENLDEEDPDNDLIPAVLLDPDDLSEIEECQPSSTPSDHVLCCVMADWDPVVPGLDRILANAENQAIVWEDDGIIEWFADDEDYAGVSRPPFSALGELDDEGSSDQADFLVATREGFVTAYDEDGDELEGLGFPYLLPSSLFGGFVVADIDNDEYVEVVFGTMDNYLHVWELGDCEEEYAPWPQCQHDARRTGALLED